MKSFNKKHLGWLIAAAVPYLYGSGFILDVQSANAMATAVANKAEAADGSTIYYNPAGLVYLPGLQLTSTLFIMGVHSKYKNADAQYYATDVHILGKQGGKVTKTVPLPQTFLSYQLNDKVFLGLGMYIPFAADFKFSHDSVLRYTVNYMSLQSLAINPTIAFKITPRQSIGFGVIAEYTRSKAREYIDLTLPLNPLTPIIGESGLQSIKRLSDQNYVKFDIDDWGFGYSLGWLWDVSDDVRVGISYRSKIKHTQKGTGEWHLDAPMFKKPYYGKPLYDIYRYVGYVSQENATNEIVLPEIISLHAMWKVNPKLNLFADATYNRHSRFTDLIVNWEHPKLIPSADHLGITTSNQTILKPKFSSDWKFALGGSYQYNDALQLRAGVSLDKSPIIGPAYRISTMPDDDRYGLGLGFNYKKDAKTNIAFSYTFLKVKNTHADITERCGGASEFGAGGVGCVSSRMRGKADYKSYANVVGFQITRKF